MKQHIEHSVVIDAPRANVWDALADVAAISNFHPAVHTASLKTDQLTGVGTQRLCEMDGGAFLDEEVVTWNEGKSLSLTIVMGGPEPLPPVQNMIATMGVSDADGGSRAYMHVDYDLPDALDDETAAQIKQGFAQTVQGILMGLNHYIMTGEHVDMDVAGRIAAQA